MIFNPSGEACMERGDLLIAIGQAESLSTLKAQASGASAKAR
jgi:K+/H+ antiporter YhaU regulatory subunit KhtT